MNGTTTKTQHQVERAEAQQQHSKHETAKYLPETKDTQFSVS
jgi:hypothetical protein